MHHRSSAQVLLKFSIDFRSPPSSRTYALTLIHSHFIENSSFSVYFSAKSPYSHDFYFYFYFSILLSPCIPAAVNQNYETRVPDVFVMIGNDALVKCDVPSYASDMLEIVGWKLAEEGRPNKNVATSVDYGKQFSGKLTSAAFALSPILIARGFISGI